MRSRRFTSSLLALLPALLFILPLTGCAVIETHLGMRTYLAKIPVTTMTVAPNPGIGPGQKTPMVVSFVDTKGKTWVTEGRGKGKILWKDIAVTPTLVTAKKGTLRLNSDPRVSDGKTGHVVLNVPSHPTLTAEFDVAVRYDYAFRANYSGSSGSPGSNGTDGTSGSSGSSGSIDLEHPSAGGDGGRGTDGGNGSNGGDGGDGPDVQVYVTMHPGPKPLLECSVSSGRHDLRYFLVDPNGGSLSVSSSGGSGGSGGKGGRGGSGGSGGSGIPAGSSGSNGSDGSNGTDGRSGSPGSVSITYDPSAAPYMAVISGNPAPTMSEAPVAALW